MEEKVKVGDLVDTKQFGLVRIDGMRTLTRIDGSDPIEAPYFTVDGRDYLYAQDCDKCTPMMTEEEEKECRKKIGLPI